MSLINEFERNKIYAEMEGNSKGHSTGFGKFFVIVLFLSIGFASGSIYSAFVANNNSNISTQSDISATPVISSNTSNGNNLFIPTSVANVVNATAHSVVEITQYSTNANAYYYGYSTTSTSNGSGVIISDDGYIVTNNHVISGAEKITVRLRNGTEYEATLVGKDSKTDVAIIKIDASDLTRAKIGNSSSALVGDFVLAIGNPLGELGGTVTYGYISALEREITIDNSTMNLMQFDAAVNPGNSGGALFNINGELIGIVSAKSTGYDVEGLGFAIPINDISNVIDDILTHGYATNRPFLGISTSNSSYTSNSNPFGGYNSFFNYFYQQVQYGAVVDKVVADSPAEKAGIKEGDIIISIDGNVISSSSAVSSAVESHNVGDEIEIGIIRDGKTMNLKATLAEYTGQ